MLKSVITSLVILHIEANSRLLQSLCPRGECLDPDNECQTQVTCFADPCSVTTKCGTVACISNYCGGCHSICDGKEGDTCCIRCMGLCGVCPQSQRLFGCCGTCTLKYDASQDLVCDPASIPQCKCGPFLKCAKYYDGCNTCTCTQNGAACTEMACSPYLTPTCVQCEYYTDKLNTNNGECEPKVTCSKNSDCSMSLYKCKKDPICFGEDASSDTYCTTLPEVCVDTDGECAHDSDCTNGYKCDGYKKVGMGQKQICIKYE